VSVVGRLRQRLGLYPLPLTEVRHVVHAGDEPWRKPYVIMTLAGHKPSGLADAFGGYLCACRQSSWLHLDEFGPYGGCVEGWHDAREFLAQHEVRDGAE
jgi:hypothetical protein